MQYEKKTETKILASVSTLQSLTQHKKLMNNKIEIENLVWKMKLERKLKY